MTSPFSFSALMNAVEVTDGEVQILKPPNANGVASNWALVLSSSAIGVVCAQGTPHRQKTDKKKDFDLKLNSGTKAPSKHPPPVLTPPSKKQKGLAPKGSPVDLTVEDFESCFKVGKLGQDLFIKWNAEAAENSLKLKSCG